MKVFEIETDFTPKAGRYREYAVVNYQSRHSDLIDSIGRGERLANWKPIKLFIDNPAAPKPDFWWLLGGYVCNQRAIDVAGPCLEQVGELLPVTIEGEPGQFRLFNYCTPVLEALDPNNSIYEVTKESGWTALKIPSFKPSTLAGVTIFKDRITLNRLHLVEREEIAINKQFRSLVEESGLTGIKFNLVWTEKDGPSVPDRIWGPADPWEYRRHDGTPWIFPKPAQPSKKPVTKLVKTARPAAKKQKRTSK